MTAVLDPGLIVLAGGIGRNVDLLADPMRRELAETIPLVPDIVAGELGDDAVLAGRSRPRWARRGTWCSSGGC